MSTSSQMRKLYNHNKHKIHPSPPAPPPPPTTTINHLSILPLAIATLAAALSPADQEVLAYLISSSISTNQIGGSEGGGDHAPQFNCNCFSCYTSYWVRWDGSKNRQLIHEIIDAYEDGLIHNKKNKKHRKKNKVSPQPPPPPQVVDHVSHAPPQVEENSAENDDDVGQDKMVTSEKGSVRKVVNFIGGRIWGVWGI